MDDGNEAFQTRRESHYGQQRSSLRSNRSLASRSRPQSANPLADDYTLPTNYDNLNELYVPLPIENPTEAITYRPRNLEDARRERRGSAISAVSRKNTATMDHSRSRTEQHDGEEYTIPDNYENLNEFAGPSPVENPKEGSLYHHHSLEQERSKSRDARRSKRASVQQAPSSRRNTAAGLGPEQNLSEVAALPPLQDQHSSGLFPKDEESGSSVSGEPRGIEPSPRKHKVSQFATQLYTVSYLVFFSILGTLARLGLQWLTFYPGAPVVTSVLWANFAGTLFMGFLAEDRRLFRDEWGNGGIEENQRLSDEESPPEREAAAKAAHVKVKKTIPLYVGLATGFCGSFTSFSSFMRDVFFALSNNLLTPINHHYPSSAGPISTTSTVLRNGGYSFMALLAVIILTLALCLSGLKLGAHIAILLDPLTPAFPFVLLRKILDRTVVVVAWGAWLGAVFMAIWPPDRPSGPDSKGSWTNETWRGQAVFALVFAPAGCLLRFYASLKLNGIMPSFPLGTFAVNIFGTAVLGMAFDLQHVSLDNTAGVGGGRVGCQVLEGVMDGFCGCLTTVSTWIAELNGLGRRHAYVYGGVSVLSGLGILIIIMGSVRWTVGWDTVACVT